MNDNLFLITCAGMSGSKWLASALNKVPKLSCSHSAGMFTTYDRNYTNEEIKKILEVERLQFNNKITLNDVLNKIKNQGSYINGNVHAYRLYRLKEAIKSSISPSPFQIANLIRNPIDVTLSRTAMFFQMAQYDVTVQQRLQNSFNAYKNEFGSFFNQYHIDNQSLEVLCFIDAVVGLRTLANEIKNNEDIFHIQLEQLNDPQYFMTLVSYVSNNKIDISIENISKIVATKSINSHTHSNKTTEDKFNSLEVWKKKFLEEMFYTSDIKREYEKIGYKFNI